MKKYILLIILIFAFSNLHAKKCLKCEKIREENAKKTYDWTFYDEWLETPEGKKELAKKLKEDKSEYEFEEEEENEDDEENE